MTYEVVAERTFRFYENKDIGYHPKLPTFDPTTDKDIDELTKQAYKGECFLPTRRTPCTLGGKPFIKEELLYAPVEIKTDHEFEDIDWNKGSYYNGV